MRLISIEDQIIKLTIDALVNAGFELSVHDGGEMTVNRSTNPDTIFAAMKTTDEDCLFVYMRETRGSMGWVRFIYGNEGVEVINDYTVSLESVMSIVFNLIDDYERG